MISDRTKGFLLGTIGAACYGTNPIFAIPLYKDGMDSLSVLFFRYLLAIPVVIAMLYMKKGRLTLKRKNSAGIILMGVLMAISSLALFISYDYIGAGIASTLLFLYPIMVALIMSFFFHEKSGIVTALSIIIATGGVCLITLKPDGTTISLFGTIAVTISALSYAIYLVYINVSNLKNVPSLMITLYILVVGSVMFAIIILFGQGLTFPRHPIYWLNVIGLAILPTALSFYSTTKAITYIGSTPTAILGAFEPLTAVFLGAVILNEAITPRIAVGFVLVISGVSLIIARKDIVKLAGKIRRHL